MSRLDSHKQKAEKQKTLLLGTAIVIILILLFTFGIKFVINTSLLVNEKIGNKKDTDGNGTRNNANDFGTLSIDSIPEATNSAQIIISGSMLNIDEYKVYLNDESVKEGTNADADSFSIQIGDLQKGENTIYMEGKKKNSSTIKKSDVYTVIYKDEKPKLEVNEPADNSRTYKSDIKVSGNTDKGNTVRINDGPTVVDSQGHFQANVRLKEGENKIVVVASDEAGNREEKTLTVTYQKDE